MANPVLFVIAHPDLGQSRANRHFAASAKSVEGIEVLDLYKTYPDMFVDGSHERHRIDDKSTLVLQFPIYWYAAPGLLKEWIDRTFSYGWAYGTNGNALKGKNFMLSIATGSEEKAYSADGQHNYPLQEFLLPYKQTAHFCGMNWLEPLVYYHARASEKEQLLAHGEKLKNRLTELKQLAPQQEMPHGA
ncbi:NAD(P)H-dependent oxidoreductase [Maritalea sp. S77]|uniref:NAD(P)H-dependent oxidoreductase n=1 Tax=Maritalea sp. S77 TaxID=3415125 RepID=UPI003C7A94EC